MCQSNDRERKEKMACLDTDFLVEFERKDKSAIAKVRELAKAGELLHTTAINIAEYYAGVMISQKNASDNDDNNKKHATSTNFSAATIEKTREYLGHFSVLTLDEGSALLWGRLYGELKLGTNTTIRDRDLYIASIALANKQTLITRNRERFEKIPGLQIDGW